jgi:hypothetical protein
MKPQPLTRIHGQIRNARCLSVVDAVYGSDASRRIEPKRQKKDHTGFLLRVEQDRKTIKSFWNCGFFHALLRASFTAFVHGWLAPDATPQRVHGSFHGAAQYYYALK